MAGRRWPDETKTQALALYRSDGPGPASKATGVPQPTIIRWAKVAGIPSGAAENRRKQVEQATLMSAAKRRERVGEALDLIVERLAGIALGAMELEAEMIDVGRSMASARRDGQKPNQRLQDRLTGLLSAIEMRNLTIARSRAVSDLVRIRNQQRQQDEDGTTGDIPRTLVFATQAWGDTARPRVYQLDPETNRVTDYDLELEASEDERTGD